VTIKFKAAVSRILISLLVLLQVGVFSSEKAYADARAQPIKIKSISIGVSNKVELGKPIKFVVNVEGQNLSYDFYIYNGSKEVHGRLFEKNNYIEYTPDAPGIYKAVVYVVDENGNFDFKVSDTIMVYSRSKTDKEKAEEFVNGKNFTSKTKHFIWVDSKKNVVYVFEGKSKKWSLIRTMQCTDGKASTPTVKGSFTINGRGPWLISENPNVRARYKVRFYKSYYFHSILVNSKGKVIDSRLGQSLSHGCVRLSMENAKWVYDNIKDGTGVFIS
jgi:lipoprotein-anchoring transpeptidase ErfK/SrfK